MRKRRDGQPSGSWVGVRDMVTVALTGSWVEFQVVVIVWVELDNRVR